MKKILVLGGNRYFGKRLVQKCIDAGHLITLGNRGQTPDSFGNSVQRLILDRTDESSMKLALQGKTFDLIYDQVCYSSHEAKIAIDLFEGRVGRYVHTSTQSTYLEDGESLESHFNPDHYPLKIARREENNYGEGKRLAEAAFFQLAKFPVVAMRIPIVLGPDDYTGRLEFHIQRVQREQEMVIPNLEAETTFISSEDAARFLEWLGVYSCLGPVNAASPDRISMRHLLKMIETETGKIARVTSKGKAEDHTPFVEEESSYLNVDRALGLGFQFSRLSDWLPGLIREKANAK